MRDGEVQRQARKLRLLLEPRLRVPVSATAEPRGVGARYSALAKVYPAPYPETPVKPSEMGFNFHLLPTCVMGTGGPSNSTALLACNYRPAGSPKLPGMYGTAGAGCAQRTPAVAF